MVFPDNAGGAAVDFSELIGRGVKSTLATLKFLDIICYGKRKKMLAVIAVTDPVSKATGQLCQHTMALAAFAPASSLVLSGTSY